ncbi:hypothetical protein CIB87_10720 [Priestia megaterium]|uniref:Uncharacterized protein n=1 Tax=Priestia megaterium TaxID=1404 RepID=A0AA86I4Y2_PRIMG|nr:hypothetical protein [Priestia megaterium]AXI29461.1 hypothetical protein CIB87_10720 [Priestia megaterium]
MDEKDFLEKPYIDRKFLEIVAEGDTGFINPWDACYNVLDLTATVVKPLRPARALIKGAKKFRKKQAIRVLKVTRKQAISGIFPGDGMPKVGDLYICNPIDTKRYYDISNFHEEMRNHKLMEAQYLLRSLGATRIEVFTGHEEGKEKSFGFKSGYRDASGQSADSSGRFDSSSNNKKQTSYKANYSPSGKPFVPDDLYWYDKESQWEAIAIDRLHHGLTSFELEVEVTSDYGVDANLMNLFSNSKLKVDLKLDGNYKKFHKQKIKLYGEFTPLS